MRTLPGWCAVLAFGLSACPAAGAPTARNALSTRARPVSVALIQDRGYALVPVRVNGGAPLWFVLDTAAGASVISPATRDRLGLGAGGTAAVTGAGGDANYETAVLRSLSLGGLSATNLGVVVIDLKKFEAKAGGPTLAGILGHDFLRRYDFTLDLPGKRILLRPTGGVRGLTGAACVPNLADDPGWVVIDLEVNGAAVRAMVDTGAGRSIFNWNAARAAGVTADTPGVARARSDAAGLGAVSAPTSTYRFASVGAGATRFAPSHSRIADLPVFAALGLADKPAAIFGTNYLADRSMTVSYSTDQVCFGPAVTTTSRKG